MTDADTAKPGEDPGAPVEDPSGLDGIEPSSKHERIGPNEGDP